MQGELMDRCFQACFEYVTLCIFCAFCLLSDRSVNGFQVVSEGCFPDGCTGSCRLCYSLLQPLTASSGLFFPVLMICSQNCLQALAGFVIAFYSLLQVRF